MIDTGIPGNLLFIISGKRIGVRMIDTGITSNLSFTH